MHRWRWGRAYGPRVDGGRRPATANVTPGAQRKGRSVGLARLALSAWLGGVEDRKEGGTA